MPTFAYSGRTRGGENVTGERIADNADAAVASLRREQVLVTRIAPTKEKAATGAAAPKRGKLGKKVNPKNLAVFVRQFSVMIDAGLPLVQCLEILGNQEEDRNFAETILATRSDVESGASLADAMKKHPKAFDPLFTNMIAAGEAGGILDTILKRLATYIEKAVKLKGQVKSAMVYPIAVIVIAVVVVGVILWKVIPTFASLFSGLGAQLPFATRVVIALSDNLVRFFPFLAVGAGIISYAFKSYYATENGKRVVDGVMLKGPIIGNILRKIAVARFCRVLGTMLRNGVPILKSLEVSRDAAGPLALKAVRQQMVDDGLSRRYLNDHVARIKRIFKWAVGEQLLPLDALQALSAVPGLRAGRSDAREPEPVRTLRIVCWSCIQI
jgi:type IV pilus assembly protein PilC